MHNQISVDFSAPQDSQMGQLVRDIHHTGLLDLLTEDAIVTGSLYNGSSHSLKIAGDREVVIDFIRILYQEFPDKVKELYKIRKELLTKDRVKYMSLENKVI